MNLAQRQISDFAANGYISLSQLIDNDSLIELREIFDHLFAPPADGGKPLYYDLTGSDPDEPLTAGSVPQLLHPSHHVPELTQTRAWEVSLQIAEQLLDMGSYRREDLIVRDHAIVKPPGSTGPTPWHQDEAYWEQNLNYQELTVWIALQQTTEQMGCMQFIPGSHKQDVLPHHSIGHDPRIHGLEVDEVDPSWAVACPVPAGGATVHHCRTLHYTGPNRTDATRRAYIHTWSAPYKKRAVGRDFYWQGMRNTARDERRRKAGTVSVSSGQVPE